MASDQTQTADPILELVNAEANLRDAERRLEKARDRFFWSQFDEFGERVTPP